MKTAAWTAFAFLIGIGVGWWTSPTDRQVRSVTKALQEQNRILREGHTGEVAALEQQIDTLKQLNAIYEKRHEEIMAIVEGPATPKSEP